MKAAQYFDIKIVTVPLTSNYQPDLTKYELVSEFETDRLLVTVHASSSALAPFKNLFVSV